MKVVVSSGHGKLVRGASGFIDEVDEARRVVDKVKDLFLGGITVFHDDVSTDQSENLDRIVDFHNSVERDLDCSIHFNAYNTTDEAMGTECLYLTQADLSAKVSAAISGATRLKNRGAKKRDDLFFLNKTNKPSILIEVCFVDSKADVALYKDNFLGVVDAICKSIEGVQPDEVTSGLMPLVTIGGVTIKETDGGKYVRFISDLDVCNDGSGPVHGDPYHQSATAYSSGGVDGKGKYLNADLDKYIVIPPQVRSKVPGVVMGCQAKLTNLKTHVTYDAVTGEIGPDNKTGEAAYVLAKIINPAITYNAGDTNKIYLYELWPDVPAEVDNFTYRLQPA